MRDDRLAVNNEIISGVETTDPPPLRDDPFGDDAGDSQLPRNRLGGHAVDVDEPAVIVLPTKVGAADTQLRRERRVAGEQRACLVPTGESLLRDQDSRVCQ
ncbi:MAG TPA: hypothetical protein VLL82_00925 [Mycobacterium sp.]|nr:hypothetical protein [Mycobacterium sp.]